MENWMNTPLIRKLKSICMGGYNLKNAEWSLAVEGEFPSWVT